MDKVWICEAIGKPHLTSAHSTEASANEAWARLDVGVEGFVYSRPVLRLV